MINRTPLTVRMMFVFRTKKKKISTSARGPPDCAAVARAKTHQAAINANAPPATSCPRTSKAAKVRAKPKSLSARYANRYARVTDIDECSRTSGICSNGVCENMMGTYQCVCDDGYRQTDQKFYCEG
jgi:hypothetical protein